MWVGTRVMNDSMLRWEGEVQVLGWRFLGSPWDMERADNATKNTFKGRSSRVSVRLPAAGQERV